MKTEKEHEDFMRYLQDAKNEFVKGIWDQEGKSDHPALRVIVEDFIIAFDQLRDRFADQSIPKQEDKCDDCMGRGYYYTHDHKNYKTQHVCGGCNGEGSSQKQIFITDNKEENG
jgi:hypothetical protein